MTRIALYAGGDLDVLETDFDVFVGVDAGSLFLLQHQLPLDLAIGDFDSVSQADFRQIEQAAKELILAPAEKDDTDLELALKTVFERYPQAQAKVFGALGGRIDHLLSNLFLASEPDLAPFMAQIELVGADNRILFRPAGGSLQPRSRLRGRCAFADENCVWAKRRRTKAKRHWT